MATVSQHVPPRLHSRNPATGAELGSVEPTPAAGVAEVVAAVAKVQPLWALLREIPQPVPAPGVVQPGAPQPY